MITSFVYPSHITVIKVFGFGTGGQIFKHWVLLYIWNFLVLSAIRCALDSLLYSASYDLHCIGFQYHLSILNRSSSIRSRSKLFYGQEPISCTRSGKNISVISGAFTAGTMWSGSTMISVCLNKEGNPRLSSKVRVASPPATCKYLRDTCTFGGSLRDCHM